MATETTSKDMVTAIQDSLQKTYDGNQAEQKGVARNKYASKAFYCKTSLSECFNFKKEFKTIRSKLMGKFRIIKHSNVYFR